MAKRRMIDTRFWSDNFIAELNPLDRYIFLYFLTNEHTNISGIYEVPLKRVSSETGIEMDMLLKMLARLKGKIEYINGWVAIKNFSKYQSDNESVRKGVENSKKLIPSHILQSVDRLWQSVDTLGTECDISELELEPKLELKTSDAEHRIKPLAKHNPLSREILKAMEEVDPKNKTYFKNNTQLFACDFLIEEYGFEETLNRISVLSRTNKIPYFPTITSPVQLRDKWIQLQDTVERKKEESNSKQKIFL